MNNRNSKTHWFRVQLGIFKLINRQFCGNIFLLDEAKNIGIARLWRGFSTKNNEKYTHINNGFVFGNA